MRAVVEAVLNLAPKPDGFTAAELAAGTGVLLRQSTYTARHAAYDLRKLRGKGLVARVGTTRRYQPTTPAIRTLVALLKPGRPPKRVHPLDVHYENLQREMRHTLDTLGLAA